MNEFQRLFVCDNCIPIFNQIHQITRLEKAIEISLKERIIRESVIGTDNAFTEINDIFGEKTSELATVDLLPLLNEFFGLK